jgi:hypothetical protein
MGIVTLTPIAAQKTNPKIELGRRQQRTFRATVKELLDGHRHVNSDRGAEDQSKN